MRRKRQKKIRLVGMLLFLCYTFLLIYFLFFAEWYGRDPLGHTELRYNLVPFLEIRRYIDNWEIIGIKQVILNLGGNIIGFVPFGILVPTIWKSMRRAWIVIYLGFTISVMVECAQLLMSVGSCDIDDVILNTIGTAIGYIIYAIGRGVRRMLHGKKTKV